MTRRWRKGGCLGRHGDASLETGHGADSGLPAGRSEPPGQKPDAHDQSRDADDAAPDHKPTDARGGCEQVNAGRPLVPPNRPISANVRIPPATRVPSGCSRRFQPRSRPTSGPSASAIPRPRACSTTTSILFSPFRRPPTYRSRSATSRHGLSSRSGHSPIEGVFRSKSFGANCWVGNST